MSKFRFRISNDRGGYAIRDEQGWNLAVVIGSVTPDELRQLRDAIDVVEPTDLASQLRAATERVEVLEGLLREARGAVDTIYDNPYLDALQDRIDAALDAGAKEPKP